MKKLIVIIFSLMMIIGVSGLVLADEWWVMEHIYVSEPDPEPEPGIPGTVSFKFWVHWMIVFQMQNNTSVPVYCSWRVP